ncbi:hypothetical protein TrST_g10281 [Triparma strigata]|uniref:ELMO domain-containing protein n=1 Tax=Triparma strigata TaxID=1606541 RepID=A0A9W7EPI1_9STRA|nr:hypothetical protein TrST_g10281 [Triparma strigata]
MMAESSSTPSPKAGPPKHSSPPSPSPSPPPSPEQSLHSSSSKSTTPAQSEPEPSAVRTESDSPDSPPSAPQHIPPPAPPAPPPLSPQHRTPLPSETCTHTILSTLALLGTPKNPLPPVNGYVEILKTMWETCASTKDFEFQKSHEEYIETFGFVSSNPLVELGLESGETTSGSILGGALVLQLLSHLVVKYPAAANEMLTQDCWRIFRCTTTEDDDTPDADNPSTAADDPPGAENGVGWLGAAANFLKSQATSSKPSSYYNLPLSQVTSQIAFILIQTFHLTSPTPFATVMSNHHHFLKSLNDFNDLYVVLLKLVCRYWWESVIDDLNNDVKLQEARNYGREVAAEGTGYLASALNAVGAAKAAATTVIATANVKAPRSHYISAFATVITLVRERFSSFLTSGLTLRKIMNKVDLQNSLGSCVSEDFVLRSCITKVIDDEEGGMRYCAEGYLYVQTDNDKDQEQRSPFKSKVEIDLKYGTFSWKDDVGVLQGQCLFQHISRIIPGVLKEVGGGDDAKNDVYVKSDITLTIICWDGRIVVMTGSSAKEIKSWRGTLQNYVFEYGAPPPAPPADNDNDDEGKGVEEEDEANTLKDDECELLAKAAVKDDLGTFTSVAIRETGAVSKSLHTIMDGSYSNLLHLCSLWGSINVLRFILESEVITVNGVNSKGETPLFVACANGKIEVLRLLIAWGGELMIRANGGVSCSQVAAALGSSECVEEILSYGGGTETDGYSRTCLHYVCMNFRITAKGNDRLTCLLLLLDVVFDQINCREGINGDTALIVAIRVGWRDGVLALLQAAADVNITNHNGESPWTLSRNTPMQALVDEYTGTSSDAAPTTPKKPPPQSTDKPLPSPKSSNGWIQYYDDNGNPYIFHPDTQSSLWGVLATPQSPSNLSPSASNRRSPTNGSPGPSGVQNVFGLSVTTSASVEGSPSVANNDQFSSPRGGGLFQTTPTKGSPVFSGLLNVGNVGNVGSPPSRSSPSPSPLSTPRSHHYIRRAYEDTDASENEYNFKPQPGDATRQEERKQRRRKAEAKRKKEKAKRDKIVKQRLEGLVELKQLKREKEELAARIRHLEMT